jgi:hypothetical protein
MSDLPRKNDDLVVMGDLSKWEKKKSDLIVIGDLPK